MTGGAVRILVVEVDVVLVLVLVLVVVLVLGAIKDRGPLKNIITIVVL